MTPLRRNICGHRDRNQIQVTRGQGMENYYGMGRSFLFGAMKILGIVIFFQYCECNVIKLYS